MGLEARSIWGEMSATPTSFKATSFAFGFKNFRIKPGFWRSFDNGCGCYGCMLVKDVSDGRRKLVSEIRGGGSRMSVENRRKDVIFKSLGIDFIIISVVNDGALSWRSGMRGKFERYGFVVR